MNPPTKKSKKLFERFDYFVLAVPWLAAVLYWRVLAGTRHLEDIGIPLTVLALGVLATLATFGIGLYGARGRRLRLALAWTVSTLGAWLSLMTVFSGP